MRTMRIRLFAKALAVACVFSAVAVSAASALPTVSYTGTGANKGKVTATGGEGSLETAAGTTVTCKENTITALLGASPATTATKVTVTFKGCKSAGKTCTSSGKAAGEITGKETGATVGYVKETAPKEVGVSVGKNAEELSKFKCGESTESSVKGSVIAVVGKESEYNTAKTSFPATFAKGATKGSQAVTKFVGGEEDKLEATINGGALEKSNIQQTGTISIVEGTATINA
jgi:hypothetical protein